MLPEVLCDPEPNLERVLPSLPSFEFPIWLVAHRELQTSKRIRIVFDHLVRELGAAARKVNSEPKGKASSDHQQKKVSPD